MAAVGVLRLRDTAIMGVLLASGTADAHALDIGYLRVEAPASASAPASVILDLDGGAVALLIEGPVTAESVRAPMLGERLLVPPTTAAGPCTRGPVTAALVAPNVRITTSVVCPAGMRTWRFPFLADPRVPATFQLLVKDVAADRLAVVERAAPTVELAAPVTSTVTATPAKRTYAVGGAIGLVLVAAAGLFARRRKTS